MSELPFMTVFQVISLLEPEMKYAINSFIGKVSLTECLSLTVHTLFAVVVVYKYELVYC